MNTRLPHRPDYDLAILGGGGAGLACALFAAEAGLRPIIIERTALLGGTTALSAGSVWAPGTEAGRDVNPSDTLEAAAAYLAAAAGVHARPELQRRFLELAPVAIAALEVGSELRFRPYRHHPDYLPNLPGATLCGRVLEPEPFDGRRLGDALRLLRPPIPEFTLFGGMMVDRTDIQHLAGAKTSVRSALHAAMLLLRYGADRLRGPRGRRLVMGNALVGALLDALFSRDIPIVREAQVTGLRSRAGRVTGLTYIRQGREIEIPAEAGVVLAGGGFNRHPELRARMLPAVEIHTPAAEGGAGELIDLALGLGARLGPEGEGHAYWAPVSVRRRPDGSQAVFPHFVLDRAKPGTLIVDQTGRRFLNESLSYNLFARAMIDAHAVRPSIPAFLVADARAVSAYGLGMVRPGGWGLRQAVAGGYVVSASTLAELAAKLGIGRETLAASVARINAQAASGVDLDFGRGTNAYERNLGDPAIGPNPTLAPLDAPPFYAIRLYPGDIGASTGLLTDGDARVLGPDRPISGLFAIGNEMHSVMGGAYPGPGITLGPAIAFAYAAAAAAAGDFSARMGTERAGGEQTRRGTQ